jgi:hypothetical protein
MVSQTLRERIVGGSHRGPFAIGEVKEMQIIERQRPACESTMYYETFACKTVAERPSCLRHLVQVGAQ